MLQPGERTGEAGDGTQGTRLGAGADQSYERLDNTSNVSILTLNSENVEDCRRVDNV